MVIVRHGLSPWWRAVGMMLEIRQLGLVGDGQVGCWMTLALWASSDLFALVVGEHDCVDGDLSSGWLAMKCPGIGWMCCRRGTDVALHVGPVGSSSDELTAEVTFYAGMG